MDRGYLRPLSPPRRFGGHPARNSTGLLDLHPPAFDSHYNQPRGSRDSLPGPRSSADRFDRVPSRPQHRDSLPLRRNPEDYEVAPRRPDPRRPLIVPPPDANYRPKIQSALDATPEFRRLRPRDEESYYVQPAASRNGHHRTLSSSGHGNREYHPVRRVDSDRSSRENGNAYYNAPAIRVRRDKDDQDYGYEYTNHQEQAYRDFATRTRPRRESDAGPRERPTSIAHMEDLTKRPPVSRAEGPPVTTRGFNKLDRGGSVRQYHYPRDVGADDADSSSRRKTARDGGRGDIAVHQDRIDGYSSANEDRSHKHRSRRDHSAEPRYQSKHEIDGDRSRKSHERHLSVDEDQYRTRHRGSRDESREHRRSDADRKERKDSIDSDYKRRDWGDESEREHRRHRGADEDRDLRLRDRAGEPQEPKVRRHKRDESYDRRNNDRYEDRPKDKHSEKHDHHHLGEAAIGAAAAAAAGGAGLFAKQKYDRERAAEAVGDSTREPKEERRRRRRHYKDSNEESDTSTNDEQTEPERKERRRRRRDAERERGDGTTQSKNGKDSTSSPTLGREREEQPLAADTAKHGDERRSRRRPEESDSGGSAKDTDQKRQVRVVSPSREPEIKPKGILKQPKEKFPEDPAPIREGVAPLKDAGKKGVPPNARWTKIDRRLVNPEALEVGNERFEERPDYVIVLRVLNKEEIEAYAAKTAEIREARHEESKRARMAAIDNREHDSSDEEKQPLAIADRPYNEPELLPGVPGYDKRENASYAAVTNNMAASAPNLQTAPPQRPEPYPATSYQRLNPSGSGSASLNSSITSAATWPQPGPPSGYQSTPQQAPQQSPPPISPQTGGSTSGVTYPQVPPAGSQQRQHYPPPPQAPYPQTQYPPPPPPSGSTSPPQSQPYGQPNYPPPMHAPGVAPRGYAGE